MSQQPDYSDALFAARCIADRACQAGILTSRTFRRPTYNHMGAVLADSVLQAGLNYTKVVKPRIEAILETFPHAETTSALNKVIAHHGSREFLQWQHSEKVARFEALAQFMTEVGIDSTDQLCAALRNDSFRSGIRRLRGIGPKTVDYMACLVGVDCIAVDRHIRSFAEFAGLERASYDYLRDVFGFAADLLSISRREFDASIWYHQSLKTARQQSFAFID